MVEIMAILKEFLDGIPQFLKDRELDCPFLTDKHFPGVFRVPSDYTITELETGDGYTVTSKLAPTLLDCMLLPGWYRFKNVKGLTDNEEIYEVFLAANVGFVTDFVLEDFVKFFNDYYQEFLNDKGIAEENVKISGNSIRFVGPQDALSDETSDDVEDAESEAAE